MADLYAILYALYHLLSQCQHSIFIVGDSCSALIALESFNPMHPMVVKIQHYLFLIFSRLRQSSFGVFPVMVVLP